MTQFKLHDSDETQKGFGAIDITDLFYGEWERANMEGYGIFWVPNEYVGARKKENLTKINFWFCDIDGGKKEAQLNRIKELPIPPSFIIESKNGYHCYWGVDGDADLETFEKIEKGIIQKLGGDPHCIDPLRLLRAPGYFHMKNPKEPFFVNFVAGFNTDKAYTQAQMLSFFGLPEPQAQNNKQRRLNFKKEDNSFFLDEKKWETTFKLKDIVEGCRNSTFAKYVLWMRDEGLSGADISYVINGINSKIAFPLKQTEINRILAGKGI